MEELKQRTDAELYERRGALAAEAETPDADLDAIETEMKAINAELEQRRAAKQAEEDALRAAEEDRKAEEAKRAEMRKLVAEGAGEPINIFKEERKTKTMDLKEIRKSPAYIDAWVEGMKKSNFAECRRILTENALDVNIGEGDGIVPVPTMVEDRIRGLWENNEILRRIRRTYIRGNLEVSFEVSSTGAVVHDEGAEDIDEEELILGTVKLVAIALKKTISVSKQTLKLRGEEFLDYIMDEFENKIMALLCKGVINAITSAPDTSDVTEIGVPVIESSVVTLDIVAQALGELMNDGADPVIVMNRRTHAAFRAAQLAANYAVDPYENLPVLYNSNLPAIGDAEAGDTWLIVGDLAAVQANFPAGDQVEFIIDPYSGKKRNMVEVLGELFVALGLTEPGMLCKVIIPEGD